MNAAKAAAAKAGAAAAAGGAGAAARAGGGAAGGSAASAAANATAAAASHAAALVRAADIAKEAQILALRPSVAPLVLHPSTGTMTLAGALPDRPPAREGAPRVLRKRLRLHPHWKLRPVRKWVDFAPYVKEIKIAYDPGLDGSAGARCVGGGGGVKCGAGASLWASLIHCSHHCSELGRQVYSTKVRKLFPKYTIDVQETHGGEQALVTLKMVRARFAVNGCRVRQCPCSTTTAYSPHAPFSCLCLRPMTAHTRWQRSGLRLTKS